MRAERHFIHTLPADFIPEQLHALSFDPIVYSRFKHGCRSSIELFAPALAQKIDELTDHFHIPFTITASAYKTVPTAINLLLEHLLSNFFQDCMFDRIKLTRSRISDMDYATLSIDERLNLLQGIQILNDLKTPLDTPLIVVDDCYVTGTHENAIRKSLEPFCPEIHFIYLADFSHCRVDEIEKRVNTREIKSVFDLLPLLAHPEYLWNSRVLKNIFLATDSDFREFLSLISEERRMEIYLCASNEGYQTCSEIFSHKMGLFSRIHAEAVS